jgi:predicted HTH transcriptional regulator
LTYPLFHPRSRRPIPLTLSREEFAREFPREGDQIEFKAGVGKAIRETAVAFSNVAGGVILVGVDDAGTPRGRALEGSTADAIHDALSSAHELGRYDLHPLDVEGMAVTVLAIARREQGFAQNADGRVLVRRGTRDAPLFGADLQRLINERSAVRFETTITDVAVGDVADEPLGRLGGIHGWAGDASPLERMEEAGLARDGRLTVAGALYLLEDPAAVLGKAFVEIIRYPDDHTPDYDRREEVRGPLDIQLQAATRAVVDHLGTELVEGRQHVVHPEPPGGLGLLRLRSPRTVPNEAPR